MNRFQFLIVICITLISNNIAKGDNNRLDEFEIKSLDEQIMTGLVDLADELKLKGPYIRRLRIAEPGHRMEVLVQILKEISAQDNAVSGSKKYWKSKPVNSLLNKVMAYIEITFVLSTDGMLTEVLIHDHSATPVRLSLSIIIFTLPLLLDAKYRLTTGKDIRKVISDMIFNSIHLQQQTSPEQLNKHALCLVGNACSREGTDAITELEAKVLALAYYFNHLDIPNEDKETLGREHIVRLLKHQIKKELSGNPDFATFLSESAPFLADHYVSSSIPDNIIQAELKKYAEKGKLRGPYLEFKGKRSKGTDHIFGIAFTKEIPTGKILVSSARNRTEACSVLGQAATDAFRK